MTLFLVKGETRTGAFSELTQQLAREGVNVLIYGVSAFESATAAFFANDEETAVRAIRDAGIEVQESPVVFARMRDQPGEAARVSRLLADAGVGLTAWLPVDTSADNFTVAIGVEDEQSARTALGERATEWRY